MKILFAKRAALKMAFMMTKKSTETEQKLKQCDWELKQLEGQITDWPDGVPV